MSQKPYIASEDSALLRRVVSEYSGRTFLEIGAGNAGTLIELSARFADVVGTDIVRPAMMDWKKTGVDFVLADGATCLRSSTFDLVAFNPPYIAAAIVADKAVEGGEELQVPLKFLREALRVVRPDGAVIMLLNDGAELSKFKEVCASAGFRLRRVASRRVFFEELYVFVASAENKS
ncbi:MAG TPA: methyltransferase domain-containing protein [Nitrososphaerales archaeon]|nr:methyltransferase domain-containing protein [Nitrososphaerales archaeon]